MAVDKATSLDELNISVGALLEVAAGARWIRHPVAHATIIELASSYGLLIDAREWLAFRSLFADPVRIDLSSVNGSSPATLSIDDYVKTMARNMALFDSTQHLFSNYIVRFPSGSTNNAYGIFNGIAHHVLNDHDGSHMLSMGVRYSALFSRQLYGKPWRFRSLKIEQLWASGAWDRVRRGSRGDAGPAAAVASRAGT